jgi:hypothetical protein
MACSAGLHPSRNVEQTLTRSLQDLASVESLVKKVRTSAILPGVIPDARWGYENARKYEAASHSNAESLLALRPVVFSG